jgi:hypothetical protein
MVHDSTSRTSICFALGIYCGALVACAGQDTPPLSDDDRTAIIDIHVRGMSSSNPGRSEEGAVGGASTNTPPSTQNNTPPAPDAGGGGGSMSTRDAGAAPGGGTVCDGFPILKASCGNGSFCHGAGSMVSAFADTPSAAAAFVGENAQGSQCSNSDALIFDPDDPSASLVITKLGASTPCGGPMPLGSPAGSFEPDDIECIQEWIGSL